MYQQEGLGVDFKYTAPGTTQQNGCIEQKFTTLFNQVPASLNGTKLITYLQYGLWAKAANTNMFLGNNLIIPSRTLTHFKKHFGKKENGLNFDADIC